jgi:energy-coupling factor transporter ATP-binding protein EcfA2
VLKLMRARVANYRSIRDSGWFDVEPSKTILVGPNEAGKTALFRALQTINPPEGEGELQALRDYPRAEYSKIQRGAVKPSDITVAEASFEVDDELRKELAEIDPGFGEVREVTVGRWLNNNRWVILRDIPYAFRWKAMQKDAARLRAHLEKQGAPEELLTEYDELQLYAPEDWIERDDATALAGWLTRAEGHAAESQDELVERLHGFLERPERHKRARALVLKRLPVFVYYSTYFAVRPRIHLTQLAERIQTNTVDEDYDFGNVCLLKLLGFDPAKLAEQGRVEAADRTTEDEEAVAIEDKLDERLYALNAAGVELTTSVRRVWGADDFRLVFRVDGDYLKVVVEDEEGVEIELDQRSQGLVWLVSFYVVFKAEAMDNLANAILLLDEPGLSLHALKQQQFRQTVSQIAEDNQTLYTTHSPFMVGPDELDLVRVVEMKDRATGTKVHEGIVADDPASLFPLQAALGYNLAQSLFAQHRNLVCEGLPDLWYIEGVSDLLRDAKKTSLDQSLAVVPAGGASKVVYFATLLHSQDLKVAALLDSDQAGDTAATQDDFVRLLTEKRIHRTKDHLTSKTGRSETEDLLRETLVKVAKDELGWDVSKTAKAQPNRPIAEVFEAEIKGFSKYRLAKAFLRWSAGHTADDLAPDEISAWESLFGAINKSLK